MLLLMSATLARLLLRTVAAVALSACGGASARPVVAPTPRTPEPPAVRLHVPAATITWTRVRSVADIATPPPPGTYRVHLIDVGSGLSMVVQGNDFTMLYDAGSSDRSEPASRVVDYLAALLGPSGDASCVPSGAPVPSGRRRLDHVVLSHPHVDHGRFMAQVLRCFDVANVWDSGRLRNVRYYTRFLQAVAANPTTAYHSAAPVPADRTLRRRHFALELPPSQPWSQFVVGDRIALGAGAVGTLLTADPGNYPDANSNSIVIALQLGGGRVLLVGDAESGPRAGPDAPLGDVEAKLLGEHAAEINADVLQLGHHGSDTSSRRAFIDAVSPSLALASSGPKVVYGRTVPDLDVIATVASVGATMLRTDAHDAACDLTGRIGGDTGAGGCDSYVITIAPAATPAGTR